MPLHHTQTQKQIVFTRTNGGMAIPVDVTLTSTWLRPASIKMSWGGIPVTHTTIEGKEYLYISQSDVKAHHAYLEKTFAAKINKKASLNIGILPCTEYYRFVDYFNMDIARDKKQFEQDEKEQPVFYVAHDFFDYGDYSINQEREIRVMREPMLKWGEEIPQARIAYKLWNDMIGNKAQEWRDMYAALPDNKIMREDVARCWINYHAEQIGAIQAKKLALAEANEKKQKEKQQKENAERAEVEANELMIFADMVTYGNAGNKMLHSIGCNVGDTITVYSTRYEYDMKRENKPYTSTYHAKGELSAAGFTWDANDKQWTAPYTDERWQITIEILKKYDTKYWPADLKMGQCWECGTYHPYYKLRDDGGMPYCGC